MSKVEIRDLLFKIASDGELPDKREITHPDYPAQGVPCVLAVRGLGCASTSSCAAEQLVGAQLGIPQERAALTLAILFEVTGETMPRDELLNRPCGGRFGNIVESIGNTPLVELPRLSPKPDVRIYAKLEGHNPTGSVKDRVAKSMIEAAEAEGAIEPGQTILEPTSGNTGIALAMICRRKGYPLKVVMPDNVTEERTQLLKMYGAEIVYSEGAKGSNGAVEVALELAEQPNFYMPYQYGNEANPLAHYNGTAVEILEELDEVTAFVGGLGTGGTLMGNGRRLKEANPETLIVAAEPMQGELVDGLRSLDDGFIPPIIDISLLDRKIMVSNRDAIVWTRKLLDEEGVFAGVSAGAIARIANRIAGELDGGNVVFLIPDDGWKYLSSGVYTKPIEEIANLDSTVWW
jgi:cysteine synthase B